MPERFGRYELLDLLGRGGMGEVYRAHDTERGRDVALKVLPEFLAGDAKFEARFRRESRLAAQLSDPHIVPIHDFGEIDGRLYIDMRLVVGSDLSSVLEEHERLPAAVAVDVIAQVASALDAAHADGLLHRDVKPSNVMLSGLSDDLVERPPFAYLVDFGIARSSQQMTVVTEDSSKLGTVAYMAPERIGGEVGDARADVYALACVLYETLTGELPFDGEIVTMIFKHMSAEPPRASEHASDVTAALDDVIMRGMAKNPDDRYPSAGDLGVAARRAVAGLAAPATGPRTPQRAAEPQPPRPSPGRHFDTVAPTLLRRPQPGRATTAQAPAPWTWGSPPTHTVTLWCAATDRHTRLTVAGTSSDDRLRGVLEQLWTAHGGAPAGTDGVLLATFDDATRALAAAAAAPAAVAAAGLAPLCVGVHTAEVDPGDAYWPADLDYAQQLAAAARGGQVLLSATTRALAPAPDVEAPDVEAPDVEALGAHSLPGFPTARPIYHLLTAGSSAGRALPRSFDPPRPSVPIPKNAMIGRDDELEDLAELITGEALVTLIGSAGVGKTRLATEAAHRVAPRFESVWFVGLDAVTDAAEVLPAIARVLNVPELEGVEPLDRLIENLRGRRVLLLLDHVQHVLEVAPAITALVAANPATHILVTSQAPLQLLDEQLVRLVPLETPDEDTTDPGAIVATPAVQALLERARRRRPSLAVDDRTAVELADLARRVEGIPLAIGLAAAGLVDAEPGELVAQWDADGFGRGMTGVLNWAAARLTAAQHRLLVLLAAFPDGFSPASARLAFDGADDDLRALITAGLVYPVEDGRFRMWAPVRRYGEQLAARGSAADRGPRGVATAIIRTAETSEPNWLLTEAEGRARLGADLDTIVASLSWTRRHAPDLHLQLACATAWFLNGRGFARLGRGQLELAAAAATDDRLRARRIQALGLLDDTPAGSLAPGGPTGQLLSMQAADRWRALEAPDREAASLAQAANRFSSAGMPDDALAALDRAAQVAVVTDADGVSWLIGVLRADALSRGGRHDEAAAYAAAGVDGAEPRSLRHARASTVAARVARRAGRLDDALGHCGTAMQGLAPYATTLTELALAEVVALVLVELERVTDAAAVFAICATVHGALSWPVPASIATARERLAGRLEPERLAIADERARSYRTDEGLAWIARLARGESDRRRPR